jgi:glycerol-3-phosphate acyltransferase PlsY
MIILNEILLIICAYLLGSIPNALIISKLFFKKDIREFGSKNMGATNTLRVLGLKYAAMVFILDAMKASILVILFTYNILDNSLIPHLHPIYFGFASIIGHIFPIFAKFKGGKGVACTTGILLSFSPLCFLIEAILFFTIFLSTKIVSLSSIISITGVFISSFFIGPITTSQTDYIFTIFCGVVMLIIIFDHSKNIKRLINGTESKIDKSSLEKSKIKIEKK